MTARQFALKAPAAIFFILKLLYSYGHCTMVISVSQSQAFLANRRYGSNCRSRLRVAHSLLTRGLSLWMYSDVLSAGAVPRGRQPSLHWPTRLRGRAFTLTS